MNRNDKSKLMMKTRSFSESVLKLCSEYSDFLSNLESCEQEKIDNLPECFESSSLSDKLDEGINSVQEANESIEQITDLISGIPDILNITMRKAAKRNSIKTEMAQQINLSSNLEKKTERIQIVITPSLNKALRLVSNKTNVSMNEIVNSLLSSNLQNLI